jgi:Dyp-type peroxidase family
VIGEDAPGAGGTVLAPADVGSLPRPWEALSDADQEQVIGRRKLDSVELEDKPADSHVASTDQDGSPVHVPRDVRQAAIRPCGFSTNFLAAP